MRVLSLNAVNFTPAHAALSVDFPTTGIVIVMGANGTGKTAIIEAICWCLYGRTLRGTDPTRADGTKVTVAVMINGEKITVRRERKRGKKAFLWIDDKEFDTETKGQQELDSILPSFNLWQTSSVLKTTDAAKFASATDSERKKLLESVIGLDKIDLASKACHNDYRAAEADYTAANERASNAAVRVNEAQRALDSALAQAQAVAAQRDATVAQYKAAYKAARAAHILLVEEEPAVNLAALEAEKSELWKTVDTSDKVTKDCERELQQFIADVKIANAELTRLHAVHDKFNDGECPTCRRQMSDEYRLEAANELSSASLEAEAAELTATEKRTALIAKQQSYVEKAIASKRRIREIDYDISQLGVYTRRVEAAEVARRVAKQTLDEYVATPLIEIDTASIAERCNKLSRTAKSIDAERNKLKVKMDTLATVDKILGTKGVRSRLIDDAVGALSNAADSWLRRISDNELSLNVCVVGDAVALAVSGSADDNSYRACSSGQQRRVDTALMFALSDIVAGASRQTGSSVFADEIFDALDSTGSNAVVEALEDLAKDRMVLVITHRPELASQIAAEKRISFGR